MTPLPPGRSVYPGLFIAGTDTGVGKTMIASAILRYARTRRGQNLIPFKPVETGVERIPEDAARLLEASLAPVTLAAVCPFPLSLPAAPQAAAAAAGLTLSLDSLRDHADRLAARGAGLVVESAGGLLAPYAPGVTGADLAAALGLPILLVARTALGTINHVALTVHELTRRALPLAALILVQTQPDRGPHEPGNLALIEQLTGVRAAGIMGYVAEPTPDALAQALAHAVTDATLRHLLDLAGGPLSP